MTLIIQSEHAVAVWTSIRISREGDLERVLQVSTDLATSAFDAAFDEAASIKLVDATVECMRENPTIDRAEISPAATRAHD